jgi:hypothetical protein
MTNSKSHTHLAIDSLVDAVVTLRGGRRVEVRAVYHGEKNGKAQIVVCSPDVNNTKLRGTLRLVDFADVKLVTSGIDE